MRGHVTDIQNPDNFTIRKLLVSSTINKYPTYWTGLEDIRFVTEHVVIVTVPEFNPRGNPSIFRATIDGDTIHSFVPCFPNNIEKNWMPLSPDEVIYSVYPLVIKHIVDDQKRTLVTSSDTTKLLEGYHGSTNGIPYNDSTLFLTHINKERSYHRWILVNFNTNEVSVSDEFVFFKYAYIEFPCSLCVYNGRYFVSLGVNDCKAFIFEFTAKDIESSFSDAAQFHTRSTPTTSDKNHSMTTHAP